MNVVWSVLTETMPMLWENADLAVQLVNMFQNHCFCLGQVKYLFFKWKWIDDDGRAGLLRRWRVWRGSKMHSLRHEQGRSKLFRVCFSIFKNIESFQINNSSLIFLIRSAYLTWHEAWPIDSCEKWNTAFPLSEFLKKHPFSNFILNVRGSHQLLWARSRETCSSAQETLRAPGLQSRCDLLFPCMKNFVFAITKAVYSVSFLCFSIFKGGRAVRVRKDWFGLLDASSQKHL